MADPGRATGADNDAEIRGSVRQSTLLAALPDLAQGRTTVRFADPCSGAIGERNA